MKLYNNIQCIVIYEYGIVIYDYGMLYKRI